LVGIKFLVLLTKAAQTHVPVLNYIFLSLLKGTFYSIGIEALLSLYSKRATALL
jgi:hypothetical protein